MSAHKQTGTPNIQRLTNEETENERTGMEEKLNSFPIIVIGASMGGLEALRLLVSGLPANLGASICIVWHMAPEVKGILPEILQKAGVLEASLAVDGEVIKKNHIYVAPPDHHLLIDKGSFIVSHGPKENRFRPAIDPLFRSAAYAYNEQVIGVVLTGALDDGTAGLWTIKNRGGFAVVQDPKEAEMPSMPEHALRYVAVDYCVPLSQMPHLLVSLVREMIAKPISTTAMQKDEKLEMEIKVAADESPLMPSMSQLGELSTFTCPDCHGVLTTITEGSLKRFRCHTGHAFSFDSLISALTQNIEDNLWNAIRSIKESIMLLDHVGDHYAEMNQKELAAQYFKKAQEAKQQAEILREMVTHHQRLNKESTVHIQSS